MTSRRLEIGSFLGLPLDSTEDAPPKMEGLRPSISRSLDLRLLLFLSLFKAVLWAIIVQVLKKGIP